jgi:predicted dehydrogenase
MQTIRIGFIGAGGICRSRHVPGLQKIDGVELVTVCNRSRESSERAAEEFGIGGIDDSWQAVIARDDLDAIVIGTYPYTHKRMSIAALDAGKHVFCQARMAMDYAEARAMYERAQRSDRVAMLCAVPIGLSIDATMARLLHPDYLGELRLIRVQSFASAYAAADTPMNWRKDERFSGLNMLTLGMYIEVLHRWFGWTKCVQAMTNIFVPERVDESGETRTVQVPDQILFNAEMENGAPAQYVLNSAVHHGVDTIAVYGSKATLRYDVGTDTLYGAPAGGSFEKIKIVLEDFYDLENWRVEQEFIDAIREGAEYHPNFEDGMRYMQVIQAVYDSAAQRRTMDLELV